MKKLLQTILLFVCIGLSNASAQTVTIGQNPKNILTGPSTFIDNVELRFGTGGTMACEWSTTDANANAFVCSGPEGGAVDVPVFVFGDATCNALDIGLFNGLTNGTVAAMNDACTGGTYFSHDGTDGTITSSTGDIQFVPAGVDTFVSDNSSFAVGNDRDSRIIWETADADAHYMNIALTTSRNIIISEDQDIDWGHAAQTNPTLWIHSADGTDATDWMSFAHNQTNAVISTGNGNLNLVPNSGIVSIVDNARYVMGTSDDVSIAWNTTQTVDGWYFGTSDGQNTLIIAENGDRAYDFAHGAQTNPAVFIHSAAQSTTQWLSLTHDGTNSIIGNGTGDIEFRLPNDRGLLITDVITDASLKEAIIKGQHYTNAEQNVLIMGEQSTSTTTIIDYGGGNGLYNSATRLSFYTAADNITTTGTERIRVNSTGVVIIGAGEGGTTIATGNTFRAPDIVTGGAGNIAGADLTVVAGLGTGTGDVGQIIFQTPRVAAAGDNIQAASTLLVLDGPDITASGLISWDAGVAITAASYQIGRNADATNRLQWNVPTGAIHEISINDVATVLISSTTLQTLNGSASAPSLVSQGDTNTGLFWTGSDVLGFSTNATEVGRFNASGNLILGVGEGLTTAATGNTFRVPNIATGGAGNIAGADLTIAAGLGTGTGDEGTIIFSLPIQAAAGDNIQTTATRLTLDMAGSSTVLTMNAAQAMTVSSVGNLTLSTDASNDVLIGDNATLLYVDGGANGGIGGVGIGQIAQNGSMLVAGWDAYTMAAGTTAARHFYTQGNVTELAGAAITDIVGAYFNTFTITDGGGAETVGIVSTVYIPNAPTAGTTPTNGPYAFFVDGGVVRADGGIDLDANGVRITEDSDGAITFLGLGDGFDEDLTINLDDTENVATITSSTALATVNFSSIVLQESGVGVLNNDEIDASSELLAIMDDETGTGLLTFATSPTFTTSIIVGSAGVSFADDGDGAITLLGRGDGFDENLILNLDDVENTGTFTSGTALATINFSSIALQESGNGVINVTDCINVLSTEHNPTEAGATNDFVSLNLSALSGSAFSSTETDNDTFMVPVAMVARNLRAEVSAAPGVGNDAWIVTLRDDAASTALTCTIDEAATNCSDSSNAPAIVAGSKLDILVDSSGAGADPNAAATMNISFCLGQ